MVLDLTHLLCILPLIRSYYGSVNSAKISMKLYPIWNENSHGPACGSADIHTWMAEGQCPSVIVSFSDLQGLLAKLDNLGLTEIAQYMREETSRPN